jgi:hypothetical protein
MTASYNVQHAPMGAFSSFTVGHFGTRGGFGSQIGRPGDQNVFVGYQRDGVGEEIRFLPFFEDGGDRGARFAAGPSVGVDIREPPAPSRALREDEIARDLGWATDHWVSGPLSFELVTAFFPLPDPARATPAEVARASCPALFAVLRLDNRDGDRGVSAMFAVEDRRLRDLETSSAGHLVGVAYRGQYGFACRPRPGAAAFMEFSPEEGMRQAGRRLFRMGQVGGVVLRAAPGAVEELVIALGFHNPGVVTTGIEASYGYARHFADLEAVLSYALDHWDDYRREAAARDAELAACGLNPHQRFLLAHATHSYWGSTEWLELDGQPLWVVNEGEYEMINTFDLAVDQVFFELRFCPWAVRAQLELYADRYSYRDEVLTPDRGARARHPGGLSFTHDQGVSNQFAAPGHSVYETRDLPAACFSYMTYEELTNWICCAGVYAAHTTDDAFLRARRDVIADCQASLLARDDPDPARRDGIMSLDSARCGSGAEITTYDSLDPSLGQARGNLYLAVKTWASHVALAWMFERLGERARADESSASALRCARTVAARWDPALGYIPAIFDGQSRSAIIPAIEGLVYPHAMGLGAAVDPEGPYGFLITALRRHFQAVFRPGLCRFEDGGWKLSSTSDNSWMSKIALCQYVARAVLGIDLGPDGEAADRAHADWQRQGAGYWAASDQMINGVAKGSRYYPRLVTAILWLDEK